MRPRLKKTGFVSGGLACERWMLVNQKESGEVAREESLSVRDTTWAEILFEPTVARSLRPRECKRSPATVSKVKARGIRLSSCLPLCWRIRRVSWLLDYEERWFISRTGGGPERRRRRRGRARTWFVPRLAAIANTDDHRQHRRCFAPSPPRDFPSLREKLTRRALAKELGAENDDDRVKKGHVANVGLLRNLLIPSPRFETNKINFRLMKSPDIAMYNLFFFSIDHVLL